MKPKNHVWLGLALVWGMLCPFIVSAEANLATPLYLPTADEQIEISVVRSDAKGETSFSTQKVQLHSWFSTGKRTYDQTVRKFGFYRLDKTLDLGLHPAPRMQFLLILKGTIQVETTDGEKRRFPPVPRYS